MQFRNALNHILYKILLLDPRLDPIYILKLGISDNLYHIIIATNNIPQLGVVFLVKPDLKLLVALQTHYLSFLL